MGPLNGDIVLQQRISVLPAPVGAIVIHSSSGAIGRRPRRGTRVIRFASRSYPAPPRSQVSSALSLSTIFLGRKRPTVTYQEA
jgi:hypothetical protein